MATQNDKLDFAQPENTLSAIAEAERENYSQGMITHLSQKSTHLYTPMRMLTEMN